MDYFAHGFWTYLIFHRFRWKWWALFFGVLPDTASWFIFSIYNAFTNSVQWGAGHPDFSGVPNWTWTLYGISHSIIVFSIVFIIVWLFTKNIQWVLIPWLLHILIDIPTHSREFLPTPFLWPLSEWRFPGFSWGVQWFMILNYSALILLYIYFFLIKPWREQRLFPRKSAPQETFVALPKARKRKSDLSKTKKKKTSNKKK